MQNKFEGEEEKKWLGFFGLNRFDKCGKLISLA